MNASFKSYRDLEVWRKAMSLTREIYTATALYPNEEKFGLVSQMRRAAVSIPSNLAEGHARRGAGEFKHFISIATGSVAELETQVILSADLGFLDRSMENDLLRRLDEIGKMLRGLYKSLTMK
ncbi:MAG TPA: four helix bundle protein [Pyrinomonadaceae bacterium]|nr:four helix bundle protein [Pyrinomonadaceae bacterium]